MLPNMYAVEISNESDYEQSVSAGHEVSYTTSESTSIAESHGMSTDLTFTQ